MVPNFREKFDTTFDEKFDFVHRFDLKIKFRKRIWKLRVLTVYLF